MMPNLDRRSDWTKVSFGDVVTHIKDRVQDVMACGLKEYIRGEHFEPANLRLIGRSTLGDGKHGSAFCMRFRPGDVLYVSRNPQLRKVAIADFEGICANTTYVCRAKEGFLLQDLLPFVMLTESFVEYTIRNKRGSTNFYLNWSDIAGYEFPLPPLEEQRRIVRVLLQVQRLEEAFIFLRTATQELIDSRSRSLFEYDLTSGTRKFSDVVRDWAYGPRFSSGLYKENGTLAQLRTTDINEEGEICYETIPLVDLDPADYDDHLLRDSDLVMSRSGSCGMTAVFREQDTPTIAAAFMFRISPNPEMDSRYLHEFFRSCLGRQLTTSLARGGVQKNIKGSQLLEQQIPCPSSERQEEVTFELSSLRNVSRSTNDRLIALSRLRRSLLTSLEGAAQ